jgi:uncharacterized protein (UPF0248 family)
MKLFHKEKNKITDILQDLHWLPVEAKINCRIIILDMKSCHGLRLEYLPELLQVKVTRQTL